ncbi:MAG: hypothetical protein ABW157_22260 [Candidatus Thiodiazotropha sp. LLP2]
MDRGPIRQKCERNMIIPAPLVLTDVLTEDVGERPIHPLDLAVTRGVITSRPRFMNTDLWKISVMIADSNCRP